MPGIFTATLTAWAQQSQQRMEAIVKGSISNVIYQASVPVGKGGNMPVDTGFLRASGQISFDGMPSGNGVNPAQNGGQASFDFDESAYQLTIAKMTIGKAVYWGWTAEYATYQEEKRAFLRLAVQNWQEIVNQQTSLAQEATSNDH